MKHDDARHDSGIAWPTLGVCALCYGGFVLATAFSEPLGWPLALCILTLVLTLHSSFTHEVTHGHPFRSPTLNALLVFPALGLLIPFHRFRDTHLAHHHDPSLTDPYDDPETNFIDPAVWAGWSPTRRRLYEWNNTLLGRMVLGPFLGLGAFFASDIKALCAGDRAVAHAWLFHAAGLVPVALWFVFVGDMAFGLYALAIYFSLAFLKIRTFLEHRAHERARCRSVIIEDRGLLSFLFLKNNLHAVHHACPTLPWYRLQAHYDARREAFLARNGGYAYRSYADIARLFLFRAKDPVPHTLWPQAPLETASPPPLPKDRQPI